MPCRQVNVECKTTDRVTHRATTRGHIETLESEIASLRNQVASLDCQLRDAGAQAAKSSPNALETQAGDFTLPVAITVGSPSLARTLPRVTVAPNQEVQDSRHRSSVPVPFLPGCLPRARAGPNIGETYFGVASADELSPVKGLALSLFNMTIDLGDCIPDDDGNPLTWWMTYDAIAGSITGEQHERDIGAEAKLPDSYEECRMIYNIWNSNVHPCFPLLHKPDFEDLVRISMEW